MTAQMSREELKQSLIECSQNASGMFEVGEGAMCAMMALLEGIDSDPVVTDAMALAFHQAITDDSAGSDDIDEIKTGLRAALANYAAPPAPYSRFIEHIRAVSREVEKWPEWKRQMLTCPDSPAPVASTVPDGLRMALSNAGIAAPESDEMLFATHEKYVQLLVDWVKDRKPFASAPVAVPDDLLHMAADAIEDLLGNTDRSSSAAAWYDLPGKLRAAIQPEPVMTTKVPDDNGLLPCPFCGGKAEEDSGGVAEFHGHEHQDLWITCQNCGAEITCNGYSDVPCSCHHDIRKNARDRWNRRAAMQSFGNSEQPVSQRYTLPAGLVSSVKCWCRSCRPVSFTDARFIVCPECGNKRCPRANDHRNACTGSNEPGQPGSAYPAAPEQEV